MNKEIVFINGQKESRRYFVIGNQHHKNVISYMDDMIGKVLENPGDIFRDTMAQFLKKVTKSDGVKTHQQAESLLKS